MTEVASLRGAARSLRSLFTPDRFTSASPTMADEVFARPAGRPLCADVYLPAGDAAPRGSALLVHGGGFTVGHRRMKPMRFLATRLRAEGFAVGVGSYRKLLRGGDLPRMLDDVASLIAWWDAQRGRLGAPEGGAAMVGLSAGGCLALRAAEAAPTGSVSRVVSVFGLYDLAAGEGALSLAMRPLLLGAGDVRRARAASPLHRPPPPVPVTLLHGTDDTLVPYAQAEALARAWQAAGATVRLHTYPGAPHAFFNDAGSAVCEAAWADLLAAVRA
jgi:acetyl esterase/lipase